jgi:hypothetical protein
MSDIDYGHESHDLEAGEQEYGHQDYNNDQDHSLESSQFGAAEEHELDQHYEHGEHIEYDDGHGKHVEVTTYTVVEVHEESSEQFYGEHEAESGHGELGAATEAADEGHEERFDAFEYFQQHISHSVSEFGESFGKLGDLAHVGDIGHGSDYSEGDFGLNAASNSNSGNDDTGFGELSAASN